MREYQLKGTRGVIVGGRILGGSYRMDLVIGACKAGTALAGERKLGFGPALGRHRTRDEGVESSMSWALRAALLGNVWSRVSNVQG